MKISVSRLFAGLASIISLTGCSLGINSAISKSYPPLSVSDSVKVFSVRESAPPNAELIGRVRIYDAGTFKCSYNIVVEAAKVEARKAGGNALKITEHLPPSIWSTCHQITANIIRIDTASSGTDTTAQMQLSQTYAKDSVNSSLQRAVKNYSQYKDFFLSAEGGWSWRTNTLAPNLNSFQKEYLNELRSGHHYGVSATYYFSSGFGVGLMYDNHFSSNSVLASAYDSVSGTTLSGELRDKVSISLIAATVDFRWLSKSERNSFHMRIGLGYCGYKNEGGFINYGTVTGSTFGLAYDFSYDFHLGDNWYFAPSVSYKIGALKSYDININNSTRHVDLDKDSYEGLSRFDLSAGLRYKL